MTLQTSGPISFTDVNDKLELPSNFSSDLNFLNNQIRIDQRPQIPNMFAFYGKNYYQRDLDGNCNNGNCNQSFSSGNIQCTNCSNIAINCVNCDTRRWLQANCNCFSGQYNCTSLANQTFNCNCNCPGKIICTKLFELGYLPKHIFEADQRFGEWLRLNDPYAYYGYVKWASVVVDWIEKDGPQCMFWIRDKEKRSVKQREIAINWSKRIATPWAYHMAYQMGVEKDDNRAGRLIMKTGLAISRFIGRVTKTKEPTKSVAIGYLMWFTFGVFWIMAGIKG
jgi:hypothetical protein